jgi:hypothetical protein
VDSDGYVSEVRASLEFHPERRRGTDVLAV